MNKLFTAVLPVLILMIYAPLLGAQENVDNSSAVVTSRAAGLDKAPWGDFLTYFSGSSFGAIDSLAGVAIIKPGMEIHPPHLHGEEEYLMVLEGEGTWHLNGKDFKANSGDMLYAKPWDIHGISNTGEKPLKFVVWKWNTKGKPAVKKAQ